MNDHPLRTSALVLLVLAALTVFGITVIDSHRTTALLGPQLWVTIVLLTAFAKTVAIGYWFMDLRLAPRSLRWAYFGWVAVFAAATVVLAL